MMTSKGLPSDSKCVLKAEPGKLDIKRREPGILFILFNVYKLRAIMTYLYFLCRFNVIDDVIQKVQVTMT